MCNPSLHNLSLGISYKTSDVTRNHESSPKQSRNELDLQTRPCVPPPSLALFGGDLAADLTALEAGKTGATATG